MTRKLLARELAKKTGLTLRAAENLIIAFGATVTETLEKGEKIVYSNFGTFYTVHYPSKTIYHPKFGAKKTMIMLPTNVAKWMPSGNIKDLANSETEIESPTQHKAQKYVRTMTDEPPKTAKQEYEDIPIRISRSAAVAGNTATPPVATPDYDDDIEKYEEQKKAVGDGEKKPVNIYDEILGDGSHELSTIDGAIKVHKEPSTGAFNILKQKMNFFKKKDDPQIPATNSLPPANEPVSLADAGIFSATGSNKANGLAKIEQIKSDLASSPAASVSLVQNVGTSTIEQQPEVNKHLLFDKVDIKYRDLSNITVPKALLAKIPENIARKYRAVPIEEVEGIVEVAMVDPEDVETKEILKNILGPNIKISLATESDINHVLGQYQGLESEVESAIEKAETDTILDNKNAKDQKVVTIQSEDAPAAKIVSSLLKRAIHDKASNIHIEPTDQKVEVRFRIDGVLKLKVELPKEIQLAVTSRIKILSNLKIDEQRVPQDGRFNITLDGRRIDFRVSTMPVAYGEKIVMRILDKDSGILTLKDLGILGTAQSKLEDNLKKSHGMILVTGPTGSGKTTTLYAAIGELFNEGVNIITLEDPIEYQIKGINQSQVNSEIGYTFANGLRSILRQDPDIIMLGEIRDQETAEMAVHAALTGHIVLSTLHTNDSAGAMPRMVDMGVEPFLLTSSVNVIIGQRLVRKVCENCRAETKLPEEEITKIKAEIESMPEKAKEGFKIEYKFSQGKGCKMCEDTGYKGRIGIYEVLDVNEKINDLILKRVGSEDIKKAAVEEGMVTMLQDGILKAMQGVTTMEEVWRATKE